MVLTEQKVLDEILEMIDDDEKVVMVGCSECATRCHSGGEPELAEMKKKLEEAGRTVVGTVIPVGGNCTMPAFKTAYSQNKAMFKEADAILNFSCGAGIQSVREVSRMTVHPGVNTLSVAIEAPFFNFWARCAQCGDCELDWTDGLCPVVLCSKQLMNGPCGGADKGKCEIDPDRDCGWITIYKRLKDRGKLDKLRKVRGPKDHSKSLPPLAVSAEDKEGLA